MNIKKKRQGIANALHQSKKKLRRSTPTTVYSPNTRNKFIERIRMFRYPVVKENVPYSVIIETMNKEGFRNNDQGLINVYFVGNLIYRHLKK